MEIIVSGLKVRYEEAGEGKTLLFLHGWGGRWESWYPVFYPLSKKYHVVALDLPGFGESEMPKNVWGLTEYAEFIYEFIKKINLNKFIIIGHSFGGAIGVKYFTYFDESIHRSEKLVLVDAAVVRRKPKNPLLIFKHLPIPESFRNLFRSEDYKSSGEMREIFKKTVVEDLTEQSKKIDIPTLIVWGDKDCDAPLEDGKTLRDKIRNSKFVLLTNCGHFSYLEKPEEFCEAVEEFIK